MNNTSVEIIGCFNTILDPYNGITINVVRYSDSIGKALPDTGECIDVDTVSD